MKDKIKFTKFKNYISKAKDYVLNLIFPKNIKCIFCGNDVPNFEEKPYCTQCEKQDIFNNGKRCKICDLPLYDESDLCDNCKNKKYLFQKAFCPFIYKAGVKNAILKLKEDNAKYLAKPFANFMAQKIIEENITINLIIPVPSHPKTIRKRGYNQAEVLALELGNILQIPVESNAIIKSTYTRQQKKLNYKQRQKNLYDSFKLIDKQKLKDKNILIVDDILTTCATVNSIALLLKGIAKNIYVAAVARRDLVDSAGYKQKI